MRNDNLVEGDDNVGFIRLSSPSRIFALIFVNRIWAASLTATTSPTFYHLTDLLPQTLHVSSRTLNNIARKRSGIQGHSRDRHGHDRYLEFEPAILVPVSLRQRIKFQLWTYESRLIWSDFHSNPLVVLDRSRRVACYVYATFTCTSTRVRLIMIRGSIHVAMQGGGCGQSEIDRGCRICHEAGPWGKGHSVSVLSIFGNRNVQLTCH
jgi:hypothetical protein